MGWRGVRLRLLGKGNDNIASGFGPAPQEDEKHLFWKEETSKAQIS